MIFICLGMRVWRVYSFFFLNIMEKKLTKSSNKMLSGVLSGIAEYLGLDPTVVRVAYLFLTLFTAFAGLLVYLLLILVMPDPQN